MNLNYFWV